MNNDFLEKFISLDLSLLNMTFPVEAQTSILAKSLLICSVVMDGSGPVAIRVVSSAKINNLLSSPSFMSLIYNMKRRGPNHDLVRIPAFTLQIWDFTPSTTTIYLWFDS